jgi:hypothetical protein
LLPEDYFITEFAKIITTQDPSDTDPIKTIASILYHNNSLRPTKLVTETV